MTAPHSISFSTENFVGSRAKIESFHEIFGRSMLGVEIKSLLQDSLFAKADFHCLADVRLAHCSASDVELARPTHCTTDGKDDVGFYINLTGTTVIQQGRHELLLAADDAALILSDEPATVTKSRGNWIGITVPRKLLFPMEPGLLTTRRISGGSTPLKILVGYIRSVLAAETNSPPDMAQLYATHISEIIAAALKDEIGSNSTLVRMQAIKADIESHLNHLDLSVTRVASRQGITARAVQMLFQRQKTTFTDYVLGARLERAHRLLHDPRWGLTNITSIALACGFNDVSYFNRAFRRRFGMTPSETRRPDRGGSLERSAP